MAHYKLNETDELFLEVPSGAVTISSGVNGTETFIERDKEVTVRIVLQSVAYATADAATLETCIELGGALAKSEDGPVAAGEHLHAMQSVQVVVKGGDRLSFKACPQPLNAKVLKTVVYTADLK